MASVRQAPEAEALVKQVTRKFELADQNLHRRLRTRWDSLERDYHNYRDFIRAYADANPPDRDTIVRDARHEFGHPLFIPYTFATVEMTLAQILANPPHPNVLPSSFETLPENAEAMGHLVAWQQDQIDIELRFQSVGKSALKFGLGVGKTGWKQVEKPVTRVVPSADPTVSGSEYALNTQRETVFDGPTFAPVSIRDFLWDPFGWDLDSVRYLIHRTWRDTDYILARVTPTGPGQEPQWPLLPLTADDLRSSSGIDAYTQVYKARLQAQGFENFGRLDPRGTDIHEVWEYHDGAKVHTIVDRKWLVASFPNPSARQRFPFQIFRPIEVEHQFFGKGVIEPMRDLQLELNDLRTDRRWNALMALHQFFFYDDTALDPDDATIYPGAMIPTQGNPNDMIRQGLVKDIPNSGYQEEAALISDIEKVTGLKDPVGAGVGAETATGVQLVQSQMQVRIQQMVRRAERELAVPVGRDWVERNQRMILQDIPVRVPSAPTPDAPDKAYEWVRLGPKELAGDFAYDIEGNSTQAQNMAQERSDAQTLAPLLNNPMLNQAMLLRQYLRKLGYANPEAYIAPQPPPIPSAFVDMVKQYLPEPQVQAMLAAAQKQQQEQTGGGGQ